MNMSLFFSVVSHVNNSLLLQAPAVGVEVCLLRGFYSRQTVQQSLYMLQTGHVTVTHARITKRLPTQAGSNQSL